MSSLLEQAKSLYDASDLEGLIALAEANWPDRVDAEMPSGISEVCRYLRILAYRKSTDPRTPADEAAAAAVLAQIWWARALSAAVLTRAGDTAAGLLLQPFMILTRELQAYEEARWVLDETLRLVPEDHPRSAAFRGRVYSEKRAFSFASEGRFGEARENYLEALGGCGDDSRGALKVRGGAAMAGYLALQGTAASEFKEEAPALIAEMKAVLKEAAGYSDVADAARRNLALMESRQFEDWIPFETV